MFLTFLPCVIFFFNIFYVSHGGMPIQLVTKIGESFFISVMFTETELHATFTYKFTLV